MGIEDLFSDMEGQGGDQELFEGKSQMDELHTTLKSVWQYASLHNIQFQLESEYADVLQFYGAALNSYDELSRSLDTLGAYIPVHHDELIRHTFAQLALALEKLEEYCVRHNFSIMDAVRIFKGSSHKGGKALNIPETTPRNTEGLDTVTGIDPALIERSFFRDN